MVSGSSADLLDLFIGEYPQHPDASGDDPLAEHLRAGLVAVESLIRYPCEHRSTLIEAAVLLAILIRLLLVVKAVDIYAFTPDLVVMHVLDLPVLFDPDMDR